MLAAMAASHPGAVCAHPGIDEMKRGVEAVLVQEPDNADAHLARVRTHEAAGEWHAALAALDTAAVHGVDPIVIRVERGRILFGAGRAKDARRELDRAIARRPDAWGAYVERARVWHALGRPADAAADLERAVTHLAMPKPEHVLSWRDALLSMGRREDAVAALDTGIARLGNIATLALAAVALETEVGRFDAARARLDGLMQVNPPNPAWVAQRGDLLAAVGRDDDARAAWTEAVAMIDARPPARRGAALRTLEDRLRAALAPRVARQD